MTLPPALFNPPREGIPVARVFTPFEEKSHPNRFYWWVARVIDAEIVPGGREFKVTVCSLSKSVAHCAGKDQYEMTLPAHPMPTPLDYLCVRHEDILAGRVPDAVSLSRVPHWYKLVSPRDLLNE